MQVRLEPARLVYVILGRKASMPYADIQQLSMDIGPRATSLVSPAPAGSKRQRSGHQYQAIRSDGPRSACALKDQAPHASVDRFGHRALERLLGLDAARVHSEALQ